MAKRLPPVHIPKTRKFEGGLELARRINYFSNLPTHPLFQQIHGRLAAGLSPYRVARWVQQVVGPDDPFHVDQIPAKSLERKFRRYRDLLPPSSLLPASVLEQIIGGIELQVDVVEELSALLWYQKQRLTLFADKEKNFPLGITVEQQRREVTTTKDLIIALRDTQIALGVVPGTLPNQMTVNLPGQQQDDGFPGDPLSRFLAEYPSTIPRVMEALDGVEFAIDGVATDVSDGPINPRSPLPPSLPPSTPPEEPQE